MQRTNIHFPPELLARLEKLCKRTGILRAEFIRRAVEAALKKAEK
jgi:predicted DNA-binding protein